MVKMWNEILEQPDVLKQCVKTNNETIVKLSKQIKDRGIGNVIIAARGTSDHAGTYGKYIIEHRLGIPVALAAPSIFTLYNQQMKIKGSLVIGISQSGKAADVLEVIKGANQCGAITVSITNDEDSPLAKEAGFHLFCDAGLEKSVAATKTFTSEMMLLAQLVAEWSGSAEMKRNLEQVPIQMPQVLKTEGLIAQKAERYRFMNECFVLSRGINYPIALEAALKMQETCYVRARAYAASDFHHGPFALIENNTPVFLFAPDGPTIEDMLAMADKLKKSGAEIIAISNKEEMLQLADCAFEIPKTQNDILSPFYNAVVAQTFACRLSLAKGLNPDAPRGLNKVTITI